MLPFPPPPLSCMSSDTPSPLPFAYSPAEEPRAKSRRQRDGEETRDTAKKTRRLKSQGRVAQADQVQTTIEVGRPLQERGVRLRAKALAELLFESGKWGGTKQVLESFFGRGEVQALQSEDHRCSVAGRHRQQARWLPLPRLRLRLKNGRGSEGVCAWAWDLVWTV